MQKQVPDGRATLHGDDQRPLPPGRVGVITDRPAGEDCVQHIQGGELARTGADDRHGAVLARRGLQPDASLVQRGAPDRLLGFEEFRLPGARTDRPPEKLRVSAVLETVAARRLDVVPPGRQVADGGQLAMDDGAVTHHRTDDPMATVGQVRDQAIEALEGDDRIVSDIHCVHARRRGERREGRRYRVPYERSPRHRSDVPPMTVARSTRRLEYPVSLSYQPSTLTRWPLAIVSLESKMHDAEEPMMSVETRSSSEYSSNPASRPASAAEP